MKTKKRQTQLVKLIILVLVLAIAWVGQGFIRHGGAYADSSCTTTVNSISGIETAAASASGGATICVSAGTYDGEVILSAHPSSDITVQPVPGDTVTLTNSDTGVGIAVDFAATAQHIVLHNFYITSEVNIEAGASNITIDHNDITGGYFGVAGGSVNCSAPNAPVYPGCSSTPAISNITISGNKLHGFGYASTNNSGIDWPVDHQTPTPANSEDALHFNNFDGLHITANEITQTEEGGNHTDCLQTVWGGSDLTFDHNYEHDNQCQGFFLKDGDISNASATDNLFVRDYAETYDQNDLQVINASPLTIRNNTFWESQGNVIRAVDSSFSPSMAAVDHNVFMLFNTIDDSGPPYQLTEDYDIFKNDPYSFVRGSNSTIVASPSFTDTVTDNYQLSSNPNSIGVDWKPSDYVYGPVPTSPDSSGSNTGGSSNSGSTGSTSSTGTTTAKPNKLKTAASHTSAKSASPAATTTTTSNPGNLEISDIEVSDTSQNTATITWKTNEPASSTVRYGQNSNLNLTESGAGNTTNHSVTLNSDFLKPGFNYSAQATSVDGQGHTATSMEVSFKTIGITLNLKITDGSGHALKKALATIGDQTGITDGQGKVTLDDLPYGNQTATVVYKNQTINALIKVGSNSVGGQYQPQNLTLRLTAIRHSFPWVRDIIIIAVVVIVMAGGSTWLLHYRKTGGQDNPFMVD